MTRMLIYPFQTSDEASGDATAITRAGGDSELGRVIAVRGYDWVNMVRYPDCHSELSSNALVDEATVGSDPGTVT